MLIDRTLIRLYGISYKLQPIMQFGYSNLTLFIKLRKLLRKGISLILKLTICPILLEIVDSDGIVFNFWKIFCK